MEERETARASEEEDRQVERRKTKERRSEEHEREGYKGGKGRKEGSGRDWVGNTCCGCVCAAGSDFSSRRPLVAELAEHGPTHSLDELRVNGSKRRAGPLGGPSNEHASGGPRRHSEAADDGLRAAAIEGATVASVTIVLDDSPLGRRNGENAHGPAGVRAGPVLPEGVIDASPRRHDGAGVFSPPLLHEFSPAVEPALPTIDVAPHRQAPSSPNGRPANGAGPATELASTAHAPHEHETIAHLARNASNVASAAAKLRTSRRGQGLVESSLPVNSHGARTPVRLLSTALNKNKVHEFGWVAPVLQAIVANSPLPVTDLQTGVGRRPPTGAHLHPAHSRCAHARPANATHTAVHASGARGQPLFVVCGGCPNSFCGMQAVLYAHMQTASPTLDFWCAQPQASAFEPLAPALETGLCARPPATHHRNGARAPRGRMAPPRAILLGIRVPWQGEHKNDPGRSRALYAQFADLFALGGGADAAARADRAGGGKLRFEIVQVGPSPGVPRALIVDVVSGSNYYVHLIWQEDWTSNPFARSKYVKGKIVYQRDPAASVFFARPYAYRDGVLSVPPHAELEENVGAAMPSDAIQINCLDDS
eukprot:scaffold178679_cov28-Tisochrysis_lutea.AAC.2